MNTIEPDERLWPAILAKVSEISTKEGRGPNGMNRDLCYFAIDGRHALTIADTFHEDGMKAVYVVTAQIQPSSSDPTGRVHVVVSPSMSDSPGFWDPKAAEYAAGAQNVAVIGHRWYEICDERATGMRGYGGREFAIWFNDGRKVLSTNVWTCGVVPPTYWDRIPDNASFAEILTIQGAIA